MRIHTDQLTEQDIRDAARSAGVGLYRMNRHGSRRRSHAFDVILEGTGRTGTRYGQNLDMIAATWDEWGIFLSELFAADQTLTIPGVYEDGDHFYWVTNHRFMHLRPTDQHVRHRWGYGAISVTRDYVVVTCQRCDAVQRRLIRRTWAEFADSEVRPVP